MFRQSNPVDAEVDFSLIPMGRIGTPEDIAAAVSYIVSPETSFVTGATFDINGGRRMA